ncbi:MAG TPA: DNA gyrase inhibitor YacG [Terriglobales bacterium]|nr:DNA gyrase inhibitor YacG [Terriglobales bacterium]
MAKKRISALHCPTCRKIVLRSDPEFPFCSERCRLIDLGKWASGGYVVSTPINDPEEGEAPAKRSFRQTDSSHSNAKPKPN